MCIRDRINIVISLAYMYILAIIGTLMLVQGVTEIDRARRKVVVRKKLHSHYWIHGLPLRMRFKKSKLYESVFTPILIGLIVGFIAAIMGIGGAFILVPAMIYIIGMPTKLIPGTSLFVTIFISAIVTVLHAFNYGSIDLILVTVLILGSILGGKISRARTKTGFSAINQGQKYFALSLIVLSAKLSKADGQVSREELIAVKNKLKISLQSKTTTLNKEDYLFTSI